MRYLRNACGCVVTVRNVNACLKNFEICFWGNLRISKFAAQETLQSEWFRVNKRHVVFFVSQPWHMADV